MKQLVLIRHGKSSWKDPAISDLMRPLKGRGQSDAREMARRLAERGQCVDRVVLSPARRVLETVELMTAESGFGRGVSEVMPELYTFNYEDIIHCVKAFDETLSAVAIVGHNPAITDLINFLCLEELGNLPTCGVAIVDLDIDSWSAVRAGSGSIRLCDYPKREIDTGIG